MGRVVSPAPNPLSSKRVVPALVASYDMHGRAVGLFYTQPTGQKKVYHINRYIALFALVRAWTFGKTARYLMTCNVGRSTGFNPPPPPPPTKVTLSYQTSSNVVRAAGGGRGRGGGGEGFGQHTCLPFSQAFLHSECAMWCWNLWIVLPTISRHQACRHGHWTSGWNETPLWTRRWPMAWQTTSHMVCSASLWPLLSFKKRGFEQQDV